jgi:PqqD family protein of HPr-rel-A system
MDRPGPADEVFTAQWRVPLGARLLRKSWGDEVVVFNTASGQTHVVDALSAAVLDALEAAPSSAGALADRFSARFGLELRACAERIEAVCRRFDELGLVAPDRP